MRLLTIATSIFMLGAFIAPSVFAQDDSGRDPTGSPGTDAGCYCWYTYRGWENFKAYEEGVIDSVGTCQSYCINDLDAQSGLYRSPEEAAALSTNFGQGGYELGLIVPNLFIDIINFTGIGAEGGNVTSLFIQEYIAAFVNYAVGIAGIFAIVMIMIGGAQYMIGSTAGSVEQAKKRISDALVGLVLVLGSYTILYVVNPETTTFPSTDLLSIGAVMANLSTVGEEGLTTGGDASSCAEAWENAQSATHVDGSDACPIEQNNLISPTLGTFSCNYHFRDQNYNYASMTAGLDFAGGWGDALYAPGSGTVYFSEGDGGRCGNKIELELDGGGRFTICHVKRFIGSSGSYVEQGQQIGEIGGQCCSGEHDDVPEHWTTYDRGWCRYSSSNPCDNPFSDEECTCQPWEQSGNTSGAHAHGMLYIGSTRLPLLTCLAEEYAG